MKLDEQTLADTPILARLVTDAAVGMSGALELLGDNYTPPQPPSLRASHVDLDTEEIPVDEIDSDREAPAEAEVEVDAEGYPAIVNVKPVSHPTPARGVRLIRPRALSDVHQAS